MWASQLSDAGVERLKEQSVKRKYMLLPSAYGQLPERKIHALLDFGALDYVLIRPQRWSIFQGDGMVNVFF